MSILTIIVIIETVLILFLVGLIGLKVYQTEKICRQNNQNNQSIIDQQRSLPVGRRILCADCKLHKWFKIGLDGNVTNKPINQA